MSLFTKLSGKIIHHQSETLMERNGLSKYYKLEYKTKVCIYGRKKVLNEWEDKKLSKYICPCIYL